MKQLFLTHPYILTNFESERWMNDCIDYSSVEKCITYFNDEILKYNFIYGEMIHNQGTQGEYINIQNVSHSINQIWLDGHQILGNVKFLSTELGKNTKGLFKLNCLKFAIRGIGSILCNSVNFNKIITFDLIAGNYYDADEFKLMKLNSILGIN